MADTLFLIQDKVRELENKMAKIDARIAEIDQVLNTIKFPYTSRDINILNRRLSFGAAPVKAARTAEAATAEWSARAAAAAVNLISCAEKAMRVR